VRTQEQRDAGCCLADLECDDGDACTLDRCTDHACTYAPDPASQKVATLGGNVGENSGGPRCLKYGVTTNHILGLEAVLADGRTLRIGGPALDPPGCDLRGLLVGSEGTLAVIVKLVLRLLPRPKALRTLLALLPDFAAAGRLAAAVPRAGLTPCALEFMDDRALDLVRDRLPLALPAECGALLLVEADGEPDAVEREARALGELCLAEGALDVLVADGGEKRARLWEVRRQLSPTTRELFAQKLSEDVAVPLGRLEEFLGRARALGDAAGLAVLGYGHLGDGNVHVNVLSKVPGREEKLRMWACVEALFRLALELGGTLSAEHGVGCWKQPFIDLELEPASRELQKGLKRLFDPYDVLNPGKIFDWPGHDTKRRIPE